jgi:hypothetical protein
MFRSSSISTRVICKAIRSQACAHLSTSSSLESGRQQLRNAQSAELFRSGFYMVKDQSTVIPVEDLDQLIKTGNVRPSIFVGAYEVAGKSLGMLSRFAPPVVAEMIAEAVDEATVQQFNDSVRKMQLDGIDNIDLKETLKFHRDLRGSDPASEMPSDLYVDRAKVVATQVIYQALKVSEKY